MTDRWMPPVRPFGGGRQFMAIPWLAREFRTVVPDTHILELDGAAVQCCQGRVDLPDLGDIVRCPHGCGRHFVRTEVDVRVAKWPPEDVEDRYAGEGWTPLAAA